MDPALFHPGYDIDVPTDALAEIRAREREDLALVVILTIPSDDPGRITANLRGPLIIGHKTKLGKQLVLSEDFPTRHPLFPVSGPPSSEMAQAAHPVECRI
jgi:flagellar assembly factor FliW